MFTALSRSACAYYHLNEFISGTGTRIYFRVGGYEFFKQIFYLHEENGEIIKSDNIDLLLSYLNHTKQRIT